MGILEVRNLDIEVLISFLNEDYSQTIKRVWRTSENIYGIFVRDEIAYRTMSEQIVLIVLEHDITNNFCRLDIVPAGGGTGVLRITWGSHDAAEKTFRKKMEALASQHGWHLEYREREFAVRGEKCPFCGAIYSYPDELVATDGSVVCQNCARSFLPK